MFILQVLFKSKTGKWLAYFLYCCAVGLILTTYWEPATVEHWENPMRTFLILLTGAMGGTLLFAAVMFIVFLVNSAYDDLQKTAKSIKGNKHDF